MFTYDYDSEEEWEEEPEGGEDVNSDDARSQNSDSDHDSEVDDWMCDDDEVEFIEGYDGDAEEHQRDPEMAARNRALAKRERSNKDATARSKAPKALVPFSRGPVWESEYGKSLHSTFESMTICFINGENVHDSWVELLLMLAFADAKSGLNPLTFHSSKRESSTATKTGSSLAQAQALSSTDQATGSPTGDVNKKSASAGPKGPRKPFPQELYPALIRIITSSESKNKADLLSELSKAFPNATKVAIEAELKEHVTKSKVNGSIVWVASSGLQDKAKKDDKMEVD